MSDDKIALNLSKLVSAGLQSGLSSITTKVGEQLLGYGLNALLGTQFGTDQQLTEILNSLTSVNNSLAAIDSDLKQLEQQLSLTEQILNINGMLDSVGDDLSNITTSWGSFVGYVKKGSIEASELKDLLGNILGDGDAMADALTSIGTLLITNGPTTHNRKGLLDAWVDYALTDIQGAKVAPSGDTIKTWFQYIENNLMYLVQQLYQGMILNVNALVVQGCQQQCSNPTSQNCQDCLLNSPGTSGSDYLTMLFYPLMKGIMEQYNQSMNRLVLRFYDPTTFATAPEFLDTELLNFIWTRVDLLTALTLATPKAPENPGFVIRAYLRPSQITTPASGPKQGPPVTPPGYSQKTGKVIPPPALYSAGPFMANWYKCVDFTDPGSNNQLASFDDSDIQTVEYHWEWSSTLPPAGTPLSGFPNLVPQYYNICTLEQVATPSGDETVLFASSTDPSAILQNLLINGSGWNYQSPQYETTHNTKESNIFSGSSDSWTLSTLTMSSSVNVLYNFLGSASLVQTLQRQISYSGSNTDISLIIMATYSMTVGPQNPAPYTNMFDPQGNVSVGVSTGSPAPSTGVMSYTYNNTNPSDSESHSGSVTSATQQLSLTQNGTSSIEFQISLNATYTEQGLIGHDKIQTPLSGSLTIQCLRLGWPQPKLSAS